MGDVEKLRLARTNRTVRSAAFAYCILPIGLYLWQGDAAPAAWILLALQFLVYPHLVYWRAARSAHPSRTERDNLLLDSTLLGAWCAYLGFAGWITFGLVAGPMLNAAVNRGAPGALLSLGLSLVGAGLWIAGGGFRFTPGTGPVVALLCAAGSLAYTSIVGYVVWAQNRRLHAARDALRHSEERYRLIAENADDLVAMVDHEGRWLYTSPSYRRILDAAELEPGGDALGRIHPDDAEQARVVMARVASTARPRELGLRLVDRGGRVRQYRTRIQAIAEGEPPHRLLLVSHDITDLRESEERVLLAAHALEGMTEAIMITSADGTIVTVNRAFSEITGHEREEVVGRPERTVRAALMPASFYDEVYESLHRSGYWTGTTWSRRRNGSVYREWRSIRHVKDAAGTVTHYVHVFSEVGAQKNSVAMND